MKNYSLLGWKSVYQFTLIQTLKNKTYRSFTIILCVIAILSMPVVELITSGFGAGADTGSESKINKVYIVDESGLPEINYDSIKEEAEEFSNVSFEYTDRSLEELEAEIVEEDTGTILMHITQNESVYEIQFVNRPDGVVSEFDIETLSGYVISAFDEGRIKELGITSEQLAVLTAPIFREVEVYTYDVEGEGQEDTTITMNEYNLIIGFLVVFIMLLSYGGEGIASAIVTEKSSKIVEILLTTIRPMALIVGKVFAMLTVTLGQLVLLLLSFGVSIGINKTIFAKEAGELLPEPIGNILNSDIVGEITVVKILITILIFMAGFMFYGFIAGLAGATVSKLEELSEGIMLFTMLMIVGAYVGLAVPIMNLGGGHSTVYATVAHLLPISSVFITPIYLLFGKISIGIALLALAILVISLLLLIGFTAKIYQTLILHQGNKLKIKDLIHISKEVKGGR